MSNVLENLKELKIQVYLDSADLSVIKKYSTNFYIKGFTSNPSLMSKSGIKSYEEFIKKFLSISEKIFRYKLQCYYYLILKYLSLVPAIFFYY